MPRSRGNTPRGTSENLDKTTTSRGGSGPDGVRQCQPLPGYGRRDGRKFVTVRGPSNETPKVLVCGACLASGYATMRCSSAPQWTQGPRRWHRVVRVADPRSYAVALLGEQLRAQPSSARGPRVIRCSGRPPSGLVFLSAEPWSPYWRLLVSFPIRPCPTPARGQVSTRWTGAALSCETIYLTLVSSRWEPTTAKTGDEAHLDFVENRRVLFGECHLED